MHPTAKPSPRTEKQVARLRARALAYPETHEDFPWGHSAFKVRGKAFAFVHADGEGFSISVKLPDSNALALELPFAEPTGYGLGKSGWVSARFAANQAAPLTVLESWLEESYTAVAPKRLVKALASAPAKAPRKAARKAPVPAKPAAKRTRAAPRSAARAKQPVAAKRAR
jgi:predicted DNA-binding protein (MmcQ/YjbR family)